MNEIVSSTESYLSLLFSLPQIDPITALSSFFLIMGRLVPIMVLAPFFGAKTLPGAIRLMFCMSLCVIFLPHVMLSLKQNIPFDMLFIVLFLKELLIGFILGFLITVPFYIAQSSGSLIDFIRGSSSLQVNDPTTSTQTGPVGVLYNYSLIAIFFMLGGPILFIEAIGRSFTLIPITHLLNPIFFSTQISFWKRIIGMINYVFSIAIQLGAPSIIGVLMAEMFLGIANRLAPQVQIVFLGISLKSWVGLALLAAAWVFILNQLGKESLSWVKEVDDMIRKVSLLTTKPSS